MRLFRTTDGRSGFPGLAFVVTMGLLLAGCLESGSETAGDARSVDSGSERSVRVDGVPDEIDPAVLANRNFGEAPMLEVLVASGHLPPVSERLPERPYVIRPVHEIGTYGGAIRRALASDINDATAIRKTLSENLMGYERPDPREPVPHLAERFAFFDEGRTAVFKLRRGVRWSDGEPFTVDDILFWYEDMILDENARNDPLFPSIWLNGGEPLRMEKIDGLTLKISSDQVMGGVFVPLCNDWIAAPRHIFAQHHPRYNPDADYRSFRAMTTAGNLAFEPGIPRLSAWVPVEWVHGQRALYRRNPYYWKVDTAGNQLPYADELEFSIIRNEEVVLLKFLNGQINLYDYAISDKFGMMKNEESKGRITLRYTAATPTIAIFPNWDAPNPSLREAFRDRRVRLALSHALNREEIGAILQNGLLHPVAFSLDPANPCYEEEGTRLHSQYDPGKSRRLLDEAGFRDSDGDGFREFRDGSVFTLTIDVFNNSGMVDLCGFIAEYWGAVGLKTVLNIGLQEMLDTAEDKRDLRGSHHQRAG